MANPMKNKIYQELMNIIKCPICKKKLTPPVYMCGSGHSFCSTCTTNSSICINCKAPYTRVFNLLAQNLLLQMDNIEKCIMELEDFKQKSKYMIIQPEKTLSNAVYKKTDDELIKEKYRCWITNECKFIGNSVFILKHMKNVHPLDFEENLNESLPFSKTWNVNYYIGNNLNYAININKLLFIVHISINDDEELISYVIMYTKHSLAFRHLCQIKIECDNKELSYRKTKVLSAESTEDTILQLKRNALHITGNESLFNALKKYKKFKFTITIEKKDETIINEKKKTISSDYKRIIKNNPHKQNIATALNKLPVSPKQQLCRINSQINDEPLYPDLNAKDVIYYPLPLQVASDEFKYSNVYTVPSAPSLYERQPPTNPYYKKKNDDLSESVVDSTEVKEINEKCLIS